MAAPRHPLRSHIVALFRRGELVSVHEAVLICDASRQAITKWLKAEGINIETSRLEQLARLRSRAQDNVDMRPDRWISAKRRRREMKQAVRRFNGGANATTDQGQP